MDYPHSWMLDADGGKSQPKVKLIWGYHMISRIIDSIKILPLYLFSISIFHYTDYPYYNDFKSFRKPPYVISVIILMHLDIS